MAFLDSSILDLSAAVDVYSDWVDACDAVAKDTANQYENAPDMSTQRHIGVDKPHTPEVAHGATFDDEY